MESIEKVSNEFDQIDNKFDSMEEQLDFQLAAIDRAATKEKVEEALENYRIALLSQDIELLPKVTQNFSLVPPSNTNKFHSSTEDAAIANVDNEKQRTEHIKKVVNAVNRLVYKERAIIIRRYMSDDIVFDYEVYNELNMSERTYHRVKSRAFYNLAFALRVEVYVEKAVAGA